MALWFLEGRRFSTQTEWETARVSRTNHGDYPMLAKQTPSAIAENSEVQQCVHRSIHRKAHQYPVWEWDLRPSVGVSASIRRA